VIVILLIRRNRNYKYTVLEYVDRGSIYDRQGNYIEDEKPAVNICRGGTFAENMFPRAGALAGLFWWGQKCDRTNFGAEILNPSDNDFIQTNKGLLIKCFRSPEHKNILVPISHFKIHGKEFLANIPDLDYQYSAVRGYNRKKNETTQQNELAKVVMWGLLAITLIICVIVLSNWGQAIQTKNNDLITNTGGKLADICRTVLASATQGTTGGSTAP